MENIVPRKRIFPRKTTYPAILFPFSLCVGKGREACSPRLIVRVIRNSGGNSESNRSATAAKEARRRRKKGRGGKRARKNGIPYSAPSWGKSHASRFYEYSHFRAWGRPTGKASLSPFSRGSTNARSFCLARLWDASRYASRCLRRFSCPQGFFVPRR